MEPFETVTLGYKLTTLALDAYKAFRHSIGVYRKKAAYRIMSSLTTMEFEYEKDQQITHYVQDRTITFIRENRRLPAFYYATEGIDVIDELIVDDVRKEPKISDQGVLGKFIEPNDSVVYEKGHAVRAILAAHSINGFPNRKETFTADIIELVDKLTFVIIFPPEKKPRSVELLYQSRGDSQTEWRSAKREKWELRRTTRARWAFVWEAANLPYGNKYSIRWEW